MTDKTEDRDIKDIIQSVQLLILNKKVKGQLARDLDKLCAAAFTREEK